jgi:hypothetical protein
MPRASRRLATLAGIVLGLFVQPVGVLAADVATVTGIVVRDGAPVAGVQVAVRVVGTDVVVATATDEDGAFSVDLEARVGSELDLRATGQTLVSDPDPNGCVVSETPVGRASAVIEALPPAPVTVVLDGVVTSRVCSATATPGVTPPATDGPGPGRSGGPSTGGLLLVLGGLALAGAASLARVGHPLNWGSGR